MSTRYEPQDLDAIFRKAEMESDRAAIAVMASLVEYSLERVISTRLRKPRNNAEIKTLFNENGILGTFSEKILAAYFLKIIGPEARRELDLIRGIRNQAAHDMNPISFQGTAEIASRCEELRFGADAVADHKVPTDLRRKFLVVAAFFAANLLLRSGESSAEITEAFETTAPSLSR
jgi:hypothetical protein